MIEWLSLTDDQRKTTVDETEQLSGILATAVEKDWWVTLVLKALFQSKYKEHIVFKGGTSLSKGWDLIARFSEDIDIALSPEAFGMEYRNDPSGKYVQKLKKAGCLFTTDDLKVELTKQLSVLGLPEGSVEIWTGEIKEGQSYPDPQSIFVKYNTLYPPNVYIRNEVKIEVGVRSAKTPYSKIRLESLLNKINPREIYNEVAFEVSIVEPRKTFLEKMFLLHEEFGNPDKSKIRTERMSRHLYDLSKMSVLPIADEALADHELYDYLIQHREWYNTIPGLDYTSHKHTSISFLPVEEVLTLYRKDYKTMKAEMIYEKDADSYEQLLNKLAALQERVRLKHETFPKKLR